MGKKWEENYSKYKNGEMDSMYVSLKEKIENKKATKEEYNEYKKIEKIKSNIPKVANIVELRDTFKKEYDDIKGELARIENIKNARKEENALEDELNKINEQISKVEKQLKRKDLNKDDKDKLEKEHTDLLNKRNDNNKKYQDVQKMFEDNRVAKNAKLNKMSTIEELNKEAFELSTKISKCNMVANNLMQGLNWNTIELRLDNWKAKKYTNSEKTSEKSKKDNEIDLDALGQKIMNQTKKIIKDRENNDDIDIDDIDYIDDKEEKGLTVKSQFDIKHPRLAKMKDWFKDKFRNITGKNKSKEEKSENNEEQKVSKDNEFKNYIRQVAEKGMDEVKKEQIEDKRRQLQKAAYKRETEKFGEDYAKMSYTPKDEGR
ncbi:MAG: hypothetical protein HFJ40_01300 [Clostridia bacterium]|nr:hypothetical protein [Clostridia bacterium]